VDDNCVADKSIGDTDDEDGGDGCCESFTLIPSIVSETTNSPDVDDDKEEEDDVGRPNRWVLCFFRGCQVMQLNTGRCKVTMLV